MPARMNWTVARILAILAFIAVAARLNVDPRFEPDAGHAAAAAGADGVIGTDERKLLSEFTLPGITDQAVMRASLAATQALSCSDGGAGSASLIHRNDVIIFSAHELPKDDGKHSRGLAECVFVVTD